MIAFEVHSVIHTVSLSSTYTAALTKLKHWRGFQAINAPKAAPVLEFNCFSGNRTPHPTTPILQETYLPIGVNLSRMRQATTASLVTRIADDAYWSRDVKISTMIPVWLVLMLAAHLYTVATAH